MGKGKTKARAVKSVTIMNRLDELEGKTLKEIAQILGFKNLDSCKSAICYLQRTGKITYKTKNRIYYDFVLIDEKVLQQRREQEEGQELVKFRTWLAVSNAYRLTDLIEAKTLKPKEELEAIKELGRIERGLTSPSAVDFAKQIEGQRCVVNSWQEVGKG